MQAKQQQKVFKRRKLLKTKPEVDEHENTIGRKEESYQKLML